MHYLLSYTTALTPSVHQFFKVCCKLKCNEQKKGHAEGWEVKYMFVLSRDKPV